MLTLIERYIIEAISSHGTTLQELQEKTHLEERIIRKVLLHLEQINLIEVKGKKIKINIDNLSMKNTSKHLEVKRLLSELSLSHKELKLKKVYLSEKDFSRLKIMFNEIEHFLLDKKKEKGKVREQTILFWGHQNYGQLVQKYLN